MRGAAKTQLDAVVDHTLARQSLAETGGVQRVDGRLFQHAGPDAPLHVLATGAFEHARANAPPCQELG